MIWWSNEKITRKFQIGDIARTYVDQAYIFITGEKDLLYQFYYMENPELTGEELIDYANNYWRLISGGKSET